MEKRKVIEAVANMRIGTPSFLVSSRDFVRFAIQSAGGGIHVGRKLFVFDYRSATLQAAKAINPEASWVDYCKAEDVLTEAVQQPAKVVVMEKIDRNKRFYYVNLYPADGEPTALFSKTSYIGKYNMGFKIREGKALWSWSSESSSMSGAHWELVLVTLTDMTHRVIVASYSYSNVGHSDKILTIVDADIRQMAE